MNQCSHTFKMKHARMQFDIIDPVIDGDACSCTLLLLNISVSRFDVRDSPLTFQILESTQYVSDVSITEFGTSARG